MTFLIPLHQVSAPLQVTFLPRPLMFLAPRIFPILLGRIFKFPEVPHNEMEWPHKRPSEESPLVDKEWYPLSLAERG